VLICVASDHICRTTEAAWSVCLCLLTVYIPPQSLLCLSNSMTLLQVVDMFGCGLPVCAASYQCIHELVKEGQTGLLFGSYQELAQQWVSLFEGFPQKPSKQLLHMQEQLQQRTDNWSASWERLKSTFC